MKLVVLALALAACAACDDPKFSVEKLQDPATCMECHPKHYKQWSGSMHAYASDDPVFVAMNKRGQRDTGNALGNFCIKCHAPMAVELGVATGASFDPAALPAEAKGVTCYFCHNVASITEDHNNGLVLAMDQTMRGGAKNPVDSPAHNSAYDPMMAGMSDTNKSAMCGSCHDVITPKGVHVERSLVEWKDSVFALSPGELTCSNCHMPPTTEAIADAPGLDVISRDYGFHEHMWPAIDQALTPFPEVEAQATAIKRDLDPAVRIVGAKKLGSLVGNGGICLDPPGVLSVRLDSINPGHMYPSGAAQDRRTWLQVIAYDAAGSIVFQAGVVPSGVDPEVAEPGINGFWDRTFKDDNSKAHFFWEIARYDSMLLRPAVTRDPNSPLFDHSTTFMYQVGAQYTEIDRIEAQLFFRPLPFEAVDELITSGDLDASIRTKLETITFAPTSAKSTWLKATAGDPPAEFTNCNPRATP